MKLSDVGIWYKNPNGTLTFSPHSQPAQGLRWTAVAKENWKEIAGILRKMNCEWLHEGDGTLLLTRTNRRNNAESYIRAMPLIVPLQPSRLPHNGRIWASDGSMVPATSGLGDPKSVTATLTGPNTIVL